MDHTTQLAMEAAKLCKSQLGGLLAETFEADPVANRAYAMCTEVLCHAEDWSTTRLHRWLGFAMGVLAARGVMTTGEQSAMMRGLLVAFPEELDDDLLDHVKPDHPFRLDLGEPS